MSLQRLDEFLDRQGYLFSFVWSSMREEYSLGFFNLPRSGPLHLLGGWRRGEQHSSWVLSFRAILEKEAVKWNADVTFVLFSFGDERSLQLGLTVLLMSDTKERG